MSDKAEDLCSEHRAYERLRAIHPTLPARMFTDLATVSDQVFELVEQLAQPSDGNFHEGRMAVLALLNHAYKLYVGGLHALADGNVHAWSPCFRGVLESFGAVAYVRNHPHQVVAILAERGISAGKLRNAAVSKRPELAKDFDKVNRIVHPAEDAFWAAIASGAVERSVVFQSSASSLCPATTR